MHAHVLRLCEFLEVSERRRRLVTVDWLGCGDASNALDAARLIKAKRADCRATYGLHSCRAAEIQ